MEFSSVKIGKNARDGHSMLIAEAIGCGCCGPQEIEQQALEAFISDLRKELDNANEVLARWQLRSQVNQITETKG
jgi:hypothetical protein